MVRSSGVALRLWVLHWFPWDWAGRICLDVFFHADRIGWTQLAEYAYHLHRECLKRKGRR
jgi:hypothetical protein